MSWVDLTADRHELINGCTRWRLWLIIMTAVYIPNTDNIISSQAALGRANKKYWLPAEISTIRWIVFHVNHRTPPCPMMQHRQFHSHNICVLLECTICTSFGVFSKSWDCACFTNATWSYRLPYSWSVKHRHHLACPKFQLAQLHHKIISHVILS